jgi:hypothetical protein
MVLVEFVRSGSYGYESFENAKESYPPPQEDKQGIQERVCLKALYRMFQNGRLDELEPELVDYYFHCVEKPESQKSGEPEEELISKRSRVYETLVERKGELSLLGTQRGRGGRGEEGSAGQAKAASADGGGGAGGAKTCQLPLDENHLPAPFRTGSGFGKRKAV